MVTLSSFPAAPRRALFASASAAAVSAVIAQPAGAVPVRDDVDFNGADVLDGEAGYSGVGQVIILRQQESLGGFGACTGALINPRTVLTAAHCLGDEAGDEAAYGPDGGAVGVAFGADALPGVAAFLESVYGETGLSAPTPSAPWAQASDVLIHQDFADYGALGQAPGFTPNADVALLALDRPVTGVETYSVLLSGLFPDGQTFPEPSIEDPLLVDIVGYGRTGAGSQGGTVSGDFRRRVAQNAISGAGTVNEFLGGAPITQTLNFWYDFDDPTGEAFPIDVRGDGGAREVEGGLAPGDSGGPLMLTDPRLNRGDPIIIGTASGVATVAAPFGYGSIGFYQATIDPDVAAWILQNSPYKYVEWTGDDGDWFDLTWTQTSDPNLVFVDETGALTAAPASFLTGAEDFTPQSVETLYGLAAGPGSTGFAPVNTEGATDAPAQYFDVLIDQGAVGLASGAEIDRLTVAGAGALTVETAGRLTALIDASVMEGGVLAVDGVLETNQVVGLGGVITGEGIIAAAGDQIFAGTLIAPGGAGEVGALTLAAGGAVRLGQGGAVIFDLGPGGVSDQLAAQTLAGALELGGAVGFAAANGYLPRYGDRFDLIEANAITGAFDAVMELPGALTPRLSIVGDTLRLSVEAVPYGEVAALESPFQEALAARLEAGRGTDDAALADIYGPIDLLEGEDLTLALESLAPQSALQARRAAQLHGEVLDRAMLQQWASGAPGDRGANEAGRLAPFAMGGAVTASTLTSAGAPETEVGGSWGMFGGEVRLVRAVHVGLAAGFAETTAEQNLSEAPGFDAEAETRSTQFGAYLAYTPGPVAVGLHAGGISHETTAERRASLGGTSLPAAAEITASGLRAVGLAAYRFGGPRGGATPSLSIAAERIEFDGFRETGSDAALEVERFTDTRIVGRLGIDARRAFRLGGLEIEPRAGAALAHAFATETEGLVASFSAAPGAVALETGLTEGEAWVEAAASVAVSTRGGARVSLGYERRAGDDALSADTFSATVRVRF